MAFTVAIVGRPNVGKSTLFNRLIGKRLALVDDTPGVTRDRREGDGRLSDLSFRLIDTAGLEDADDGTLEDRMRKQTEQAITEADIVLFLVDGRVGLTSDDRHFSQLLRRGRTPVTIVVNKCEGKAGMTGLMEAFELGYGDPVAISAEHGEGLTELYEVLANAMGRGRKATGEDDAGDDEADMDELELEGEGLEEGEHPTGPLQMAVIGRPNVGKSTLINRMLGEDRLLTGPEAGITRDSIAVSYAFDGREIRLFDTAGIRRKARVQTKLEKLSVADTLRAIRYAETVILVIDGTEGLDKQDLTIASMVVEEGRGMIIAINKWDAVPNQGEGNKQARLKEVHDRLSISLPQVRGIPVVTISGRDGRNLDGMMRAAFTLTQTWNTRVPTAALNRWLDQATSLHQPPLVSGRAIRIRYATQVKARPPTFALFVSKPEDLPDSYVRYLSNSLREAFGLDGVPLRLVMRKGRNPYAKAD